MEEDPEVKELYASVSAYSALVERKFMTPEEKKAAEEEEKKHLGVKLTTGWK